ncbi:hypothetical protein [Lysobacter sp. CA199]|uniref:hypothetical protein n=1 Tax=Lysobacter sp. CA199 TaxID=3455608 RepID=UPI003F8D78FA
MNRVRRQGGYIAADVLPLAIKAFAGVLAVASAAVAAAHSPAAPEVVERIILGVRESAILASVAGTFIGVLVLPNKDTRRVSPPQSGPWWRRGALFALRLAVLAVVLLGFAWVAATSAAVLGQIVPSLGGPAAVPVAGLAGVFVRPLLPKILRALERRTDSFVGGQKEP